MVVRALALAKSPAVLAKATAPAPGQSSGKFSGVPCDLFRLKAVFPDRFAALLNSHFRNAAEVAVFFDRDEKTARNWMAGITSPNGAATLYAVAAIPGALQALMGEAA